jgi:predicted pyridoxine 5'-phosphate oxidase superfamily flavin-nucleotide-binding protein
MSILTDEIKQFVKLQKLGYVATVCPDGTPSLSPKGTVTVWDDNHLVFLDIHSPGTITNLHHNPSTEINIVDIFTRKGYRFKGVAKVFSGGEIFKAVIHHYGEPAMKYDVKNVVLVTVERIIEVTSPAYDTEATEAEIKKRWVAYWRGIYPDES